MKPTALDAAPDRLDEHELAFVAKVREHGWVGTSVSAEDNQQGFSYTTGFWVSAGAPEIIIFSMRDDVSQDILWGLFHDARSGTSFPVARRLNDIFSNCPAYLFPVSRHRYREHLGWSLWFYGGDDFPCLQLVWPDRDGRFPWEGGFDEAFRSSQPDLTEKGWLASLVH